MTLDDLPSKMVDKYRQRYQNATKAEKEAVESCLSALSCVINDHLDVKSSTTGKKSCFELERPCITSRIDTPNTSSQNNDPSQISQDRLTLTYFDGDLSSPAQRGNLLECKIENLLCQLASQSNTEVGFDEGEPYAIDIRRDPRDADDLQDVIFPTCVSGKIKIHDIDINTLSSHLMAIRIIIHSVVL